MSYLPSRKTLIGYGLLLTYVIVLDVFWGWERLLTPWLTLSLAATFTAVAFIFASYAARALRLYDYFRPVMRGRFTACFKLMLFHNLFNNLLPMRSGEVSFPLLMKRYFAVELTRSLPALLWFRLLDLHTIASLGGLALVVTQAESRAWLWVALLWLPLPLAVQVAKNGLGDFLQRHPGKGFTANIAGLTAKALEGLPQNAGAFWRSWLWTWVNWTVKLAVLAWVLIQFADMSYGLGWIGAIGGDLTSVLPIHAPGGFGTYEAGVAASLLPLGLDADTVIPAAVNLHLFVLFASLASGGLAFILPAAAGQDIKPSHEAP